MLVPSGFSITLFDSGDFWVKNEERRRDPGLGRPEGLGQLCRRRGDRCSDRHAQWRDDLARLWLSTADDNTSDPDTGGANSVNIG